MTRGQDEHSPYYGDSMAVAAGSARGRKGGGASTRRHEEATERPVASVLMPQGWTWRQVSEAGCAASTLFDVALFDSFLSTSLLGGAGRGTRPGGRVAVAARVTRRGEWPGAAAAAGAGVLGCR